MSSDSGLDFVHVILYYAACTVTQSSNRDAFTPIPSDFHLLSPQVGLERWCCVTRNNQVSSSPFFTLPCEVSTIF